MALNIRRKTGERFMIGDVEVTVLSTWKGGVRIRVGVFGVAEHLSVGGEPLHVGRARVELKASSGSEASLAVTAPADVLIERIGPLGERRGRGGSSREGEP